jgi:hypothetical protein
MAVPQTIGVFEMTEEQQEELFEYLKEHMRLDMKITSEYTGGMDGSGMLYKDSHTIQLTLEGVVISALYL